MTRALAERGHDVGLVVDTLANDAQTEDRLRALEPSAALGIHRFPMPRVFGKADVTTPLAVKRLIRSLRIDIVHGHGAKGGFHARLAGLGGRRVATFYTPHGGVLHFPAHSASGRVFHRLERWMMARTDGIIFESDYARRTYSALIGQPTCPVDVIFNGLAPAEFDPVDLAPDAADFAFVGELRALKGIFTLVEAMPGLRRKDGAPTRLVMAGDGPDRLQLEQRIGQLDLSQRVSLLGSRPAREVFAAGRAVIVPSLAESLPYVVLEAAAAQRPVIATRVGGIPEIFGPTANALIPPDDPAALSRAMQETLDAPERADAEMRERLAHIKAHFSVDRMADAILRLYQSVE
ncbi:glycosyltransferase family 4 protein [Devosia sp. PTR5]|uniref:Glycosyltransferase family 4 protein n=1 Tax=Devosia oryzisoli TaxID=2774138 RepID=A0A927FT70_9HYPH|nr:glycosyltransferase family 4 protein [Devosia oryzisoli]